MPSGETLADPVHIDRPDEVADLLRPELGNLAIEIVDDVRSSIPEYAQPLDGPYDQAIRDGVRSALHLFVEQLGKQAAAGNESLQVHRKLGHLESREGRSLDSLQAAYRIGIRVSWRRLMAIAQQAGLEPHVIAQLGEAMLTFMDQLASVAQDGFLEEQASRADIRRSRRRKLLSSIVTEPQEPASTITELAAPVGWPVPDEACVVAIGPAARPWRSATPPGLDEDVLVEADTDEPYLLVPGTMDKRRSAGIAATFTGRRMAISPSVPLHCVPKVLRWARQSLDIHTTERTVWLTRHVPELLLHSDQGLLEWLRHRWFSRLDRLTPKQHQRNIETLRTWLDTQGSIVDMAAALDVHHQTVRYRIGILSQHYGDSLHDPQARFEMQLVLRAGLQQRRGTTPATEATGAAEPELPFG